MKRKITRRQSQKSKELVLSDKDISKHTEASKATRQTPSVTLLSLSDLKSPKGARKKRKILGRGPSSGHGKTSTRGSKGQTSRAGRDFYPGFEGGQMPLIRKIPKRGFSSKRRNVFQIVNIKDLNRINEPVISPELMKQKGLIKDALSPVKILGEGEIKNALTVKAHAFSKGAQEKILSVGGKIEVLNA